MPAYDRSACISEAVDVCLLKLRSTCDQFNRDLAVRVFKPQVENVFDGLRDIESCVIEYDGVAAQRQLEQIRTTRQASEQGPFCRDNAASLIASITNTARRIPRLLKEHSPELRQGELFGLTTLLLNTTKNRIGREYQIRDERHAAEIKSILTNQAWDRPVTPAATQADQQSRESDTVADQNHLTTGKRNGSADAGTIPPLGSQPTGQESQKSGDRRDTNRDKPKEKKKRPISAEAAKAGKYVRQRLRDDPTGDRVVFVREFTAANGGSVSSIDRTLSDHPHLWQPD